METSAKARKLKKISRKLGVCALFTIENQTQNKHVESLRVACLDEGSNPSNSTLNKITYCKSVGYFYFSLYLKTSVNYNIFLPFTGLRIFQEKYGNGYQFFKLPNHHHNFMDSIVFILMHLPAIVS